MGKVRYLLLNRTPTVRLIRFKPSFSSLGKSIVSFLLLPVVKVSLDNTPEVKDSLKNKLMDSVILMLYPNPYTPPKVPPVNLFEDFSPFNF